MIWVEVRDGAAEALAPYRRLSDPAFRRSYEAQSGTLVAEGLAVVGILLRSGRQIPSVLCARSARPRLEELLAGASSLPELVLVASDEVLHEVVGFPFHRGVLAMARRWPQPSLAELASLAPPGERGALLVLEGLVDHENVGAAFRNAAALGAAGVLLDPRCADPLYRRSVRVSMGHVLRLPFRRAATWPGELAALAEHGFDLVGLVTDDKAAPISELQPRGAPVAILVGNEGSGLREESLRTVEEVGRLARIPMSPGVDSLNAATAAAIALHRLAGAGRR